ncbi:AimR family lysis-lysogeny pheromone receptor [Niallia taxi]|uniref:AimR family lysis-lysogeny pheromone receptor n=1 Tax=Niallia taxi TaxID=2499688 RepID=UPI0030098544
MKCLRQRLLNDLESARGLATEMGILAGYSGSGAFLRMLRKDDGEIKYFDGFVKVVRAMYPKDYLQYLSEFALALHPNKLTARNMLEFLSLNRQLDSLKALIDNMENSRSNKDWAKAYSIQYDYQKSYPSIDMNEMLKRIKEMRTSDIELGIYLNILKSHCYYQKGKFDRMMTVAEDIIEDLELVDHDYLIEMYKVKFNQTMSAVKLRVYNKPVESREYVDSIINSEIQIGDTFKAYAYFVKGYSYLFTSYELAKKYLQESLSLYESTNNEVIINDLKEKLETVEVYWGKCEGECTYLKNKLLKTLKSGENIIPQLEENKDKIDLPFYLFLKGSYEKNDTVLMDSMFNYIQVGDAFLANFPRESAINNGYSESVINNLFKIIS